MTADALRQLLAIGADRVAPAIESAREQRGNEARAMGYVRSQLARWAQAFMLWDSSTEHDALAIELTEMAVGPALTVDELASIYAAMVERVSEEL